MPSTQKWALITGASSGIGKALAFELAARGYSLFLVARNQEVLRQVATDCAQKSNIETQVHPADLSDSAAVDELVRTLSVPVHEFEVLVNNAGFGVHGEFRETSVEQEILMLNVQLAAMLKLTKALLPGMIARQSGRILNVASVYSFAAVPFQAVYSASKAFMLTFAEALREEVKGSGVTITTLCPGTTATEFRARAGITERKQNMGASPESVARTAVQQTLKGKHLVVTGFSGRVFVFLSRHLPLRIVPRLVRFINNARGVNE